MKEKSSQKRTKAITSIDKYQEKKDDVVWYKNPTIILAFISVFTSTAVGILSIINANQIARLDKDIYIPTLQYQISQYQPGSVIIEVINKGAASATDVTVSINWGAMTELGNCKPAPPFQGLVAITPVINGNISYNIPRLAIEESFILICEISVLGDDRINEEAAILQFLLGKYYITLPENIPAPSHTPTAESMSVITPTLETPPFLSADVKKDTLIETYISSKEIEIKVVAGNSRPAEEIGRRQIVLAYLNPTNPSDMPIVSLDTIAENLNSMTKEAFEKYCKGLINQQIVWRSLRVKEFTPDPWDLLLVITPEDDGLVISIEDNPVTINLEADSNINLFGTIESCYYQEGFQIQVTDSAISISNNPRLPVLSLGVAESDPLSTPQGRLELDPSIQEPYYLLTPTPP
jgi:hypothetical protein